MLLRSPGIKRPIRSRARLSPHTSKPPTSPCRRPKHKQYERQKQQQRLKRTPQKAKTPNDAQPHPATKRRPPSPHTLAPPPPSRKGRTAAGSDRRGHRDIQLPPSRDGERGSPGGGKTLNHFNSRPRMRANAAQLNGLSFATLFQLPPSHEGEHGRYCSCHAPLQFQLPPSHEGEPVALLAMLGRMHFNSRPRMRANGKSAHSTNISTVHIRQNSTFSLAFASLIAAVRGGGGANGACPLRVPPRVFCVGEVRAQKSRGWPASTLALLPNTSILF